MLESPSKGEAIISVENLSRKYRLFNSPRDRVREALHPFRKTFHTDFWALRDINFQVPHGATIGILGRNGSGKSTLLQILAAILLPTKGTVSVDGRVSALLELGAGFNPEFTGRDNVILNGILMGFSETDMQERLPEIESFANIGQYIDQPVRTYSSGMFVRLAFAAAVVVDPDILLIDEALAVGDVRFQQRCFERFRKLQDSGKTILFVSHDIETVINHSDRAILLNDGWLVADGDPNAVANEYREIMFSDISAFTVSGIAPAGEGLSEPEPTLSKTAEDFLADSSMIDKCPLRPNYNEHESAFGGEVAEIQDFLVMADGVADPLEIVSGSNVAFYIRVRFSTNDVGADFGLSVRTVDGVFVYGTNSLMCPDSVRRFDTDNGAVFRLEINFAVQGGDYFIDVGVFKRSDGENIRLHARRQMIHLRVKDTPEFDGLVNLGNHPAIGD